MKTPTRLGEEAGTDGSISREGADRVVGAVQGALAEARLTYPAVRSWYGWQAGSLLNIDIGGGSMELAFGRDAVPELAVSLPLGAGRVTAEFLRPDPPSKAQVKELRRYVRQQVREVANRVQWEGKPRRVVATSKTFKQIARLSGAPRGREGPFVRRTVSKQQVQQCIRKLIAVSAMMRSDLRGVRPARAWQVLGGAVVAYETMRSLRVSEAEVSPWALREGIMLEHLSSLLPDEPLTLQPLEFLEPGPTATVTALPSPQLEATT